MPVYEIEYNGKIVSVYERPKTGNYARRGSKGESIEAYTENDGNELSKGEICDLRIEIYDLDFRFNLQNS